MSRSLCIGLLLCLLAGAGRADDIEAQLKAAFVYRFVQYTQWPPPPLREFGYCVAGRGPLPEAIKALASKPLEVASIHFHRISAPEQAGQCQTLVLAMNERTELQRWMQVLADAPILVIGDSPEAFRAGCSIVLAVEPNGLSFRVNLAEARRRGLTLSSQLLKLAREVR
ncbi:YfiR family protein [Pelomonas sp. SE-A7]|uniref:YfiR family protein n=1 Tax=Pelomonas sp. SE-A7 TaxID=3054953 RepID=UPI00259CFE0F|nr:YfiR family protein [Pelomonas sp. SE-A7]MDM4764486.1 YfiR family protein [Pelomonas sp. SE-A7]